ncbi:alpha/beta hydrolase [Terrarubrum flagellatum]|uniref:alpha/beta fold hydrolase n=1 Tax=Terrirubrum flagellatum TaxID=2895980 RepID=UPI00314532D9
MRVRINDNELELEILGDRADAPVMIVHHGAPGLGSRAEPKTGYGAFADICRVVVYDARGSGESEGKRPFTHEQWVADLDAVRAYMGVESFVLAGGSYGGFIAMEYAVRHPQRLKALILRDTSPDNSHRDQSTQTFLNSDKIDLDPEMIMRVKRGEVRDNKEFYEYWRKVLRIYDANYDAAKVEARAAATPYRYETHNYAFSTNLPAYDVKDRLGVIKCPTLVVVGRHDPVTPVWCSEAIVARIPQARFRVFENSGHSPPIEEPEAFQAEVREFLKDSIGVG